MYSLLIELGHGGANLKNAEKKNWKIPETKVRKLTQGKDAKCFSALFI